jgi:hypothetical protein
MPSPVEEYGFCPTAGSIGHLEGQKNNTEPRPTSIDDVKIPDTPLAKEVQDYVKGN